MKFTHNYLDYMPPEAIALTIASVFIDWKMVRDHLGQYPPSTDETFDVLSDLYDELCELAGPDWAERLIVFAPGMDRELYNEIMELVE